MLFSLVRVRLGCCPLKPLQRAYLPLLDCLPPERTLIVWLTPYDSFKAPWQRGLVNATRNVMLQLRREHRFRRALFLDAWLLTAAPNAPIAWDGAHRESMMQTLIWTLVRFAYSRVRDRGASRAGGSGGGRASAARG